MSSEAIESEITTFVKKWRRKRGNLIMVLHEIQNAYGYVPREAAMVLSRQLEVPLGRIYEVLTFYHYFDLSSPADCVISVCMGTACYLKGAPDLVSEFEQQCEVKEGEKSEDGKYHLQSVRCVGCCGLGPVVIVNGKIHGKLRVGDVRHVLDELETSETVEVG